MVRCWKCGKNLEKQAVFTGTDGYGRKVSLCGNCKKQQKLKVSIKPV